MKTRNVFNCPHNGCARFLNRNRTTVILAALAIANLHLGAALINVDFNGGSYQNGVANGPTQSGPAVIGVSGDYWNGFVDADPSVRTGEALLDSTGAATSVTLDYSAGFNYDSMSWGTSPFVTAKSPVADLMVEFIGAGAGSKATLTLHGLAAGKYDLYLYSAPDSGNAQSRVTTFQVNGLTNSVGPNNSAGELIEGTNYLHLIPTVGTDGLLNVSFDGGTGEGDLNGFQIRPALLTVAPFFSAQPTPASVSRFPHGQVTFTAAVDGTQPISLQWRHGTTAIAGATNASLTLSDLSTADAGTYTLVASNSVATTTSDAAILTLVAAPTHFVANFDFDCGGDMVPGTYSGPGVLGTGAFWNSVPGPNNSTAGTYTSTNSMADDGVTETGVSLSMVSAGNWAGQGASTLLDDFACAYTASGQPFTFNGVPDGMYTLVLFGVNAPYADTRGTLFTVGGVTKGTTNAMINPSTFVAGDNYVRFDNVIVTNGVLAGKWAPNPVPHSGAINAEGDFNGAQLQRVGDVTAAVAPSISTEPQSTTVYEQWPAGFAVSASGSPAPDYQWQRNGANIAGATTSTYTISNAALTDAADYRVIVSNSAGSITSVVATLTVLVAPQGPAAGTFEAALLTNNPIAFWRLNDSAGTLLLYDSVGYHAAANQGVTLQAQGPQAPTYPGFPAPSHVASFDGAASAATTGASVLNGLTNFTLMGWISPAGANTDRVGLFGQNDAVELGFNDTDGVFVWIPTSIGGWVNPKSGPDGFASGQWYFVSLVANGRDVSVYVNGTQRGQVASVGWATGFSAYGFNIGGGGILDATGNFFNGQIADVAVFDRALSGQQINNLYNVAAGLIAPAILTQPGSQNALQGFPVRLTVAATGTPLSYQWQSGPANGPYTNLSDAAGVVGSHSATLVLPNVTPKQAADYRVVVSNAAGSVTSDVVSVTVSALTAPWTANFDFDCSEGGFVGTFSGAGVLGSGSFWNPIPGPSSWTANTYTSDSGLLDDGVTDTKISLILATGGSWSYAPVGNALLDDFATSDATGKTFTFNNVPDGLYNLVVFAVNGGWHDRGSIITVNGQRQATVNASSTSFIQGDNYVVFTNLVVSGGAIVGNYAANPATHGGNNTEGDFCGAQLQFVSAVIPSVTLTVRPVGTDRIALEWSSGTLMETANLVNGSWAPVPNATSPYTNAISTGQGFYRVKLQ